MLVRSSHFQTIHNTQEIISVCLSGHVDKIIATVSNQGRKSPEIFPEISIPLVCFLRVKKSLQINFFLAVILRFIIWNFDEIHSLILL